MGSKAIVFLGLLLATVLLISSEATARDLAAADETSTFKETAGQTNNGVEDAKYGGGYCRHRCCQRGYNGCDRCCSYEGEAEEKGN
ncbi:hypothetical protein Vadar_009796 [Vaccinium darrowii]|uniref:Uncharacterized protein n=1 Tax=Vaccinium darrowii TaxID=229202 RepID=A0ACB7Z386_9ERIC|nr:hypothetical protein Vadar_009796 [Vaccinium darrowii]